MMIVAICIHHLHLLTIIIIIRSINNKRSSDSTKAIVFPDSFVAHRAQIIVDGELMPTYVLIKLRQRDMITMMIIVIIIVIIMLILMITVMMMIMMMMIIIGEDNMKILEDAGN
jgi:prepilin signal peptidase PulO-like enzyme (type II secretory pathway)